MPNIHQPLYISEDKVTELLTWDKTFQAVELSLRKVAQNEVSQSSRTFTSVAGKGALLCMPGYLKDEEQGALGCKLITSFSTNLNLDPPLPRLLANILLFDNATGVLKAIVAGTEITTWRTAAASAVATKHIYTKNGKPCRILAVLGAGVQGRIHAEMFRYFFKFEEVRVWNRTASKAKQLADDLNVKYNTSVFVYYDNNEVCVRNADVIVTATASSTPFVHLDWVKSGAHINAVGSTGQSHYSELEEKIYLSSDVFIDYWEGARKELVGLEKSGVKFKGLVGGAITGEIPPPPGDRITVFHSLGMAVEDCAVARTVYNLYMENKA